MSRENNRPFKVGDLVKYKDEDEGELIVAIREDGKIKGQYGLGTRGISECWANPSLYTLIKAVDETMKEMSLKSVIAEIVQELRRQ